MDKATKEIIETLNVILAKMTTKEESNWLRVETIDGFAALRTEMQDGFLSVRDEMRDIRTRLDAIDAELGNHRGYAKEIDHLLQRVGAIEQHLGIKREIAA